MQRALYFLVMAQQKEIDRLCSQLVSKFAPEKVILFGSHARGTARPDSDVDVLVVMDFNGSPIRKAGEILQELTYQFPLDLLVRTSGQLGERLRLGDPFIREIITEGQVLHDATGARVDR